MLPLPGLDVNLVLAILPILLLSVPYSEVLEIQGHVG